MVLGSSAGRAQKTLTGHLQRTAYVYVRQSTPAQVQKNLESQENQKALAQRAISLGWSPQHVRVIDGDLGLSGQSTEGREGFKELSSEVHRGKRQPSRRCSRLLIPMTTLDAVHLHFYALLLDTVRGRT